MRISYYPDTDTLYIELNDCPGYRTHAAIRDVVIDVDSAGYPVGIEIEHASHHADLDRLLAESIPSSVRPGTVNKEDEWT